MAATEIEGVFLIADLCGYTALTEAHGNIHAAQAVARYTVIAQTVLQPGARLVERVGDEVLITAPDATSVVRTAIALRAAVEDEPLFPMLRSGIHAGNVVEQDTSYFGSALNLTARVAAHARASQILCTAQVTMLATDLSGVAYRSLGLVRFKNVLDPVTAFEVIAGRESRESAMIDPVCRMQVWPDTAPARLPFDGNTYHFCSLECAKAFAERPDHYVSSIQPG